MSVIINDSATWSEIEALSLDDNLLKCNPYPELKNAVGESFEAKSGRIIEVASGHSMCDSRHVQLHTELPFTVTYTMGDVADVDYILVSTFGCSGADYGYGRYEVYLSNDKESLYSPESYVGEYDRRGQWRSKDFYRGTAQIFTLEEPVSAKYFGIKFTHGDIFDGVVRLDLAGVFSKTLSQKNKLRLGYGVNLITLADIALSGESVTYTFPKGYSVDSLIVKNPDCPVDVSSDGISFTTLGATFRETELMGDKEFITDAPFTARIIRSTLGNIIGAYSKSTVITLRDKIINNDFLGVGTNVLPFQLMRESTESFGYDPEFVKLEHKAVRDLDIKIIRVWFQNDWFQLGPDLYDFESEKMQQFLKYMEVFRQLGTEIELDFSWVVGSALHSWYTIPEIPDQARSAPRDLKQFARSVVAALKYLCDEKGLNVKYITVSNEPANANYAVTPDNNIEEKKKYLARTFIEIDAELKRVGMRDRFEIWGPECCASTNERDFLPDIYRLAGDVVDCYTKHAYFTTNDDLYSDRFPFFFESTKGARVGFTEFGCNLSSYRKSTVGNMIAAVNAGTCVALHWCLTNSVLPDPFCAPFDERICLYRNDEFKNEGLFVESICGEIGPAIKYVPAHCQVLTVETSILGDARACAFKKGDDLTVIVETNSTGERELQLDLGGLTSKPVYVVAFNIDGDRPNDVLQPLRPIEVSNGIVTEKLTANHSTYCFTTLA